MSRDSSETLPPEGTSAAPPEGGAAGGAAVTAPSGGRGGGGLSLAAVGHALASGVRNASLLFIWAGLIILFGILEPHTFLSMNTARTIMGEQAVTAIMALALVGPIAARQFDLSISGAFGIAVIVVASLMAKMNVSPAFAIALTLLAGILIGVFNSYVVGVLKVNSFIATLGSGSILVAMQQWISGGEVITQIPKGFTSLGRGTLFTIPMPFFYMLVIAGLVWYLLEYRQTGRYLYAAGSNADAARLAGVRVGRLTAIGLVISAGIATIAGIIFLMRIGSTSLNAGAPYLLPAFAAVFLGATQFKEGNVNVPGTLVAVYVLATGVKGVQLLGAQFWMDEVINGAVLIIAVALAVRSGRQSSAL
ncbi:MAG TPA: ABC transporter permease [Solirubrobacterales bacterium]|nr:ABC transporter permease [Solirubrobacterales bacterium]